MRELVVVDYVSLDGVAQGPGHAGEDGYGEGGWSEPHMPEHRVYGTELYRSAGAFLFGRRTYEIWLDHWPHVTDPADQIAAALNGRPKYVVSSTLGEPSWPGTTVIRDDFAGAVRALRDEDGGDIVVPGSSGLVQMLTAEQLVDRYHLWIHPVALGNGKRVFGQRVDLRLVDARITMTGLVMLSYEPK